MVEVPSKSVSIMAKVISETTTVLPSSILPPTILLPQSLPPNTLIEATLKVVPDSEPSEGGLEDVFLFRVEGCPSHFQEIPDPKGSGEGSYYGPLSFEAPNSDGYSIDISYIDFHLFFFSSHFLIFGFTVNSFFYGSAELGLGGQEDPRVSRRTQKNHHRGLLKGGGSQGYS